MQQIPRTKSPAKAAAKAPPAEAMTMPSATEIRYLFPKPQEFGEVREVVPGLHWLRLHLPFALNHVNAWLLDGADAGWTIIDTGANKPETMAAWEAVLGSPLLAKAKVTHLVGTHGHPDHIGLAGWLVEKTGAPLHMTLSEWLAPQVWREEGFKPIRPEVEAFYAHHGCPGDTVAALKKSRETATFRNYPLPAALNRMRDGDMLNFGGRTWQVLVNGGHADEHASLYCAADKLFIAGDQILSRISPVVGVFPGQPFANPLADYLASLTRIRAEVPDDVLVLPSHGLPFHGLHTRITELEQHHAKRLGQLVDAMTEPKNAIQLAHELFTKAMAEGQAVLALGETLAHVHYLIGTGAAERHHDRAGGITFARAAPKPKTRAKR